MKQRVTWGVQLSIVGLCALALKAFYSSASPNDLRWILAPTTFLVELLTGKTFSFESHTGYMSSDHTFLIAASCAGVNFLLTAFLMLSLRALWNSRRSVVKWYLFPLAAVGAYAGTIIANTVRISIALYLQQNPVAFGLSAAQVHRLEGIVVYFGFLLLMLLIVERFERANLYSVVVFALLIYYGVTIGIPISNGSFNAEHFGFVLVVPIILILPVLLFAAVKKTAGTQRFRDQTTPSS